MTNPHFLRHPKDKSAAFYASGAWNSDTMAGWLDAWAERTPDQTAVHEHQGRIVTYRELADSSLRFANALLELGIRKGEVVAIQLPSCVEFLIAYFGVTRMGGVLATMHMPCRDAELDPLLRFAEAKAVICGAATEKYEGPGMMERLRERLPDLRHIIVGRGTAGGVDCLKMNEMVANAPARPIADPPVASDPALLCFTSGTSAAPRA